MQENPIFIFFVEASENGKAPFKSLFHLKLTALPNFKVGDHITLSEGPLDSDINVDPDKVFNNHTHHISSIDHSFRHTERGRGFYSLIVKVIKLDGKQPQIFPPSFA